jgi:hypothetical protein
VEERTPSAIQRASVSIIDRPSFGYDETHRMNLCFVPMHRYNAIGAVLAQYQVWKGRLAECPLGFFFSQKLHEVETQYPMYDWELLAIQEVLEHWACYVHGRLKTVIYSGTPAYPQTA